MPGVVIKALVGITRGVVNVFILVSSIVGDKLVVTISPAIVMYEMLVVTAASGTLVVCEASVLVGVTGVLTSVIKAMAKGWTRYKNVVIARHA